MTDAGIVRLRRRRASALVTGVAAVLVIIAGFGFGPRTVDLSPRAGPARRSWSAGMHPDPTAGEVQHRWRRDGDLLRADPSAEHRARVRSRPWADRADAGPAIGCRSGSAGPARPEPARPNSTAPTRCQPAAACCVFRAVCIREERAARHGGDAPHHRRAAASAVTGASGPATPVLPTRPVVAGPVPPLGPSDSLVGSAELSSNSSAHRQFSGFPVRGY